MIVLIQTVFIYLFVYFHVYAKRYVYFEQLYYSRNNFIFSIYSYIYIAKNIYIHFFLFKLKSVSIFWGKTILSV